MIGNVSASGAAKAEEPIDYSKTPAPERAAKGGRFIRMQSLPSNQLRDTVDKVPESFGVPGGATIVNKDTVLNDLWAAMGRKKPPAVLCFLSKGDPGFGHALVAYTRNGQTQVMNIVGGEGKRLVNFMPLSEYLFGTERMRDGNLERGVYNREFEAVAIWDWPEEKIEAMHRYFTRLDQRNREGKAFFTLKTPILHTLWSSITGKEAVYGNCARWTSRGLKVAGFPEAVTMFPKQIAVSMLKGEGRRDPDNVDIFYFGWVRHAHRTRPGAPEGFTVAPFAFNNLRIPNLGDRAAGRVIVDPGSMVGRVEVQSRALSRL